MAGSKGGVAWIFNPFRLIVGLGLLGLGAGAAMLGFQGLRADIAASIYEKKLKELAGQYQDLRTRYNAAVQKTAVTELVVEGGSLRVRVRNAAGVVQEFPTPYDPSREIFVDYVVVDGRLWIRRVYDEATPPSAGLVIDPALASIDWKAPGATEGKVVYRSLEEGRWIISVSGGGALGLTNAPEPADLMHAPEVREFEPVEQEVEAATADLDIGDVWRWVWGGEGPQG